MIPYNIADRTKLPKPIKYHAAIYDEKQLMTLLKVSANTPIESAVKLDVFYGLRCGEIGGLRWQCVDLENRLIHITHTKATAGGEFFQDTTKTLSSRRTLTINDDMYEYLTSLKERQNQNREFFGNAYIESDFVCCWDNDEPLRIDYISHAFSELLKENNLPRIRFHDLRHPYVKLKLKNFNLFLLLPYPYKSLVFSIPPQFYYRDKLTLCR